MTPTSSKKVAHYINAKLRLLCAGADPKRILMPEAVLEVSQYENNMKSHKVTPVTMEMPGGDRDKLIGFESVEDFFKIQHYQIDTQDIMGIRLQAFRQTQKKIEAKSIAMTQDNIWVRSDLTEQTKIKHCPKPNDKCHETR
eukprot:6656082-Ditylum_brightwellii.AAC.1